MTKHKQDHWHYDLSQAQYERMHECLRKSSEYGYVIFASPVGRHLHIQSNQPLDKFIAIASVQVALG